MSTSGSTKNAIFGPESAESSLHRKNAGKKFRIQNYQRKKKNIFFTLKYFLEVKYFSFFLQKEIFYFKHKTVVLTFKKIILMFKVKDFF